MSLQNDLELLHLRESYMKNSNHSTMLSCVNSNSSTLSEDLGHDEDQHNDSPLHSVLKQWFGGNSTSSTTSSNRESGSNTHSIRNQSCLQLSKPNDKLNRLVSFYL